MTTTNTNKILNSPCALEKALAYYAEEWRMERENHAEKSGDWKYCTRQIAKFERRLRKVRKERTYRDVTAS